MLHQIHESVGMVDLQPQCTTILTDCPENVQGKQSSVLAPCVQTVKVLGMTVDALRHI